MSERIIKFRAWDLDEKKMFLVDKLSEAEWTLYLSDAIKGKGHPVFMQFTGLKDKNGKEIYEGDIADYEHDGGENTRGFVAYKERLGAFVFVFSLGKDDWLRMDRIEIEVIGNIYQNPELLSNTYKRGGGR